MATNPGHAQQRTLEILRLQLESLWPGGLMPKIRWQRYLVLVLLVFVTGCGTPKVGLQPEYPPIKKGMFALWGKFIEVDSLQPTLRWEPFPRQEDRDADQEGFLGRIEDVTYELRIWKTITASSGELVYARERLTLRYHKLEEPLEPLTKYLWSVRSNFVLDGHPRTIEWGLAGFLLRDEVVPNPSCFRFKTPPQVRGQSALPD